jgi:hypothetical protein
MTGIGPPHFGKAKRRSNQGVLVSNASGSYLRVVAAGRNFLLILATMT